MKDFPLIRADGRYILGVDVELSPLLATALGSALATLAAQHPDLDANERLARILAAGCCAVQDEARQTSRQGVAK